MPLSAAELEIFLRHIKRFGESNCPICGNSHWGVRHIVAPLVYTELLEGGSLLGQEGNVPLVLAVCIRCFYVRTFAWIPIKRRAQEQEGGDDG